MRRRGRPDWPTTAKGTQAPADPSPHWMRPGRSQEKIREDYFVKSDELPERIRRCVRACDFDLDVLAVFRFSKHADRSKLTDEQIGKVFGDIKTYSAAQSFNKMWGQSS